MPGAAARAPLPDVSCCPSCVPPLPLPKGLITRIAPPPRAATEPHSGHGGPPAGHGKTCRAGRSSSRRQCVSRKRRRQMRSGRSTGTGGGADAPRLGRRAGTEDQVAAVRGDCHWCPHPPPLQLATPFSCVDRVCSSRVSCGCGVFSWGCLRLPRMLPFFFSLQLLWSVIRQQAGHDWHSCPYIFKRCRFFAPQRRRHAPPCLRPRYVWRWGQ